ncbi:helicase-related protein [Isoptericola sp. NPDC019571]|uniref:helicase-related protein n=1 Tax=Isoptericola sp. NPDC019571 TaxID=3364008 RepID=UPI003796B700
MSSKRGTRPDQELDAATEGLKEFQHATVRTVVDALYEQGRPRFLVADEVGLGKTKIARAVVTETIRRLWSRDDVDRIDIVYICSNSQIARQNIEDLRVIGTAARSVDRITMLPSALADLAKAPVNVVAFSPHTSLKFGQAGGRVGERAMLLHLLSHQKAAGSMMSRSGAKRIFELYAKKSFDGEYAWARRVHVPDHVAVAYRKILERDSLLEKLDYYSDGRRYFDTTELGTFVGRLRRALAEACIQLLTPDLIILDEFQRFTEIMHGHGEDAELARLLFEQPTAKVLLLSATPYKMLTNAHDDESHFEGFEKTIGFLLGPGQEHQSERLRAALGEMRQGVLGHRDPTRLAQAKTRAESILRSVMVRTERLAVAREHDGMLDTGTKSICPVTKADVDAFIATDRVTQVLDRVPSIVEYWKSAPYLLNFMDEYKIKSEVKAAWASGDAKVVKALDGKHMLDWPTLSRYGAMDPRNGRARWLIDDLQRHNAFDRLWLPPALPQTELRGAYADTVGFTKRLIFSGWGVVPKAIAGLVSYEFERRHHGANANYRQPHVSRLTLPAFSESTSERYTTLALLLPCLKLAELGDPLRVARVRGLGLPVPMDQLREHVSADIEAELRPLLEGAPTSGRPLNIWYPAALASLDPGLLDLRPEAFFGEAPEGRGLADHLDGLRAAMGEPTGWGPAPTDLIERLTDLAIAGPSVLAARGLTRLRSRFQSGFDDVTVRAGAAAIGWGFRSFFDTATCHALITSASPNGDYWTQILRHSLDGSLGSVVDEWFHLVPDQCRLGPSSEGVLGKIVGAIVRVLRLQDGRVSADFFSVSTPGAEPEREYIRTHFAMRFGQAQGQTADGENPVDVRNAFNSPFRPFVLASTSVGQEGLDFHHYAHAIVHWNLPHNPVDLEQREGRVHRYKNHAVRKNIAAAHGAAVDVVESDDPWTRLFELADDGAGDMRPWWVFTGDAAIERLVPTLPLSAEVARLQELVRATSLYRMTLGQPRQSELLEVLDGLSPVEQQRVRDAISINLAPPAN